MKRIRKMMALVIAMALCLSMSTIAFAGEQTGATSGTITVENATKGQTYKAYKIFSASYSGSAVTYTCPADLIDLVDDSLFDKIQNASGDYTVSKKSDVSDEDIISWAEENYANFDADGTVGTYGDGDNKVVFSNMPFGYYLITSTVGAVISVDTNTPDVTIKDKNPSSPTTPDKNITAEDDNEIDPTKANDAGVGSTETFTIDFNAVNIVTSGSGNNVTTETVKQYNVYDTPTGLAIDADTVTVSVNGEALASSAFSASVGDDGKLTVLIPWVDEDGNSLYEPTGDQTKLIPVVVTYDAEILAAAATAVAPNKVDVKYDNQDDVEKDVGSSNTNTYTYKFKLDKIDENGDPLLGAKFQLKKGDEVISLVATDDGYRKAGADEEGVTEIDLTEVASKVISGLDKATYTLVETQVPDTYNKAADQTIDEDSLLRVDETIPETNVQVENNKGTELPSTGGIGTTIFYITGAILVLGAGVLLVTRRRMNVN